MQVLRALLTGVAVISTVGFVQAKTVHEIQGPAETPPASYKSRQYVDSRGCAFIRAGQGSQISWVPRVTRSRQVICGQKSTGLSGARIAAPSKEPPRMTGLSQPTSTAPQTTPQQVRTPRRQTSIFNWWQTPRKTRTTTTVQQPVQATVVAAPVVRQPVVQAQTRTVARQPRTSSGWLVVRNGPQAVHPSSYANNSVRTVTAGQRVQAPTNQTALVTRAATLPANYRPLYSPEQFSGRRGVGTTQGQAAMDLIWTETVPRRLIDARTGRDVTGQVQVQYPYVTTSTSNYAPATTTRRRVQPSYQPVEEDDGVDEASPVNMTAIPSNVTNVSASVDDVAPVTVVTEAADGAKTYQPPSLRYVQVATFGVPDNAKRTLARFDASGVPTHSRPLHRNGRVYEIVLLGPFQTEDALSSARQQARSAGFRDAFFVN